MKQILFVYIKSEYSIIHDFIYKGIPISAAMVSERLKEL